MAEDSELSCCPSTLPAVTTHNYESKGKWEKLGGLKVCGFFQYCLCQFTHPPWKPRLAYSLILLTSTPQDIISPSHPTRAIMAVYDIFGAIPQTMQGCDMLSAATNAVVFMPDFFEGEPMSMSAFPPDTDEKKKTFEKFRDTKTPLEPNLQKLKAVIAAAKQKEEWKGLPWGGYGLCWGGKVRNALRLLGARDIENKVDFHRLTR